MSVAASASPSPTRSQGRWHAYATHGLAPVPWLEALPDHWNTKRLKYTVRLVNEKTEDATGMPYVGLEHIESWTGRHIEPNMPVHPDGMSNFFAPNDVLFGKLRPYLAKVLHARDAGTCTSEALVMRPRLLQPRFLLYWLLNRDLISVVDGSTFGSKMPRANWEFIGNLPTYVPPVDEQRMIVAFLDRETARIDALIRKKTRLIELLQERRAALASQAVTMGLDRNPPMKDSGIPWLGPIPKHWQTLALKRLLESADYGISESLNPTGEVAVLRMGDVQDGEIVMSELRFVDEVENALLLRTNDILFNRTNSLALVGKVAIFRDGVVSKVSFASYLVRFRTKANTHPEYLCYLLNRPETLERARALALPAIGQSNLNPNRYGYLTVCLPPFDEQVAIVHHVQTASDRINALVERVGNGIAKLREYRSAMIAAAVTGKIDVRTEGTTP